MPGGKHFFWLVALRSLFKSGCEFPTGIEINQNYNSPEIKLFIHL